jgi:hypothetical protein
MPQKATFRPKPLSIEQRNAIDLLILGKTNEETADTVGIGRETVWSWHHEHPVFMATLEECRLQVWRGPQERLRSLAMKAVENLAAKVEAGDIRCSLEVLRGMGLCGFVSHIGQTDPEKLIKQQAATRVEAEGIPEDATETMLINMSKNPVYQRRLEEIEAELRAMYGEAH